jgi:hypothetical protein
MLEARLELQEARVPQDRRVVHKSSSLIRRMSVTRSDKEKIARHRAEVFVTAGAYSESTNEFIKELCLTLGSCPKAI